MVGSLRVGGQDRLEDLVGVQPRGVHAVHRELGVGVGNPVGSAFDEGVPPGFGLGPISEPTPALVFAACQLVGHRLGQVGRQPDAETGTESAVVGQAASEVALHDDGGALGQVAPYLIGRGEQRGQVEAHPGLGIAPQVHLASQRLVDERHGRDQNGSTGRCQQRSDGRLAGAAESFEALEQRAVRHGRKPRPVPRG